MVRSTRTNCGLIVRAQRSRSSPRREPSSASRLKALIAADCISRVSLPSVRVAGEVMGLGKLMLRATLGGYFFGHGMQKLAGWFGGAGPEGTGRFFEQAGLRPGRESALMAGAAEAGGGARGVLRRFCLRPAGRGTTRAGAFPRGRGRAERGMGL